MNTAPSGGSVAPLFHVSGASPGRRQRPDRRRGRPLRAIKIRNDPSSRLVVRAHLVVDVAVERRRLSLGPDDVPDGDAVGVEQLRRVRPRKRRGVLLREDQRDEAY